MAIKLQQCMNCYKGMELPTKNLSRRETLSSTEAVRIEILRNISRRTNLQIAKNKTETKKSVKTTSFQLTLWSRLIHNLEKRKQPIRIHFIDT